MIRALLRREGFQVRSGGAANFTAWVKELEIPPELRASAAPLLALLGPINRQIAAADRRLAARAKHEPVVRRLCSTPGVGPVTAVSFVATLDQVESYLGLVPRESSSGEKQHKGRITKAGNGRTRWRLVEAAWAILRGQRCEAAPLRAWAERIAKRRGKSVAAVALARRLAGILFALWRAGSEYRVDRWRQPQGSASAAA